MCYNYDSKVIKIDHSQREGGKSWLYILDFDSRGGDTVTSHVQVPEAGPPGAPGDVPTLPNVVVHAVAAAGRRVQVALL